MLVDEETVTGLAPKRAGVGRELVGQTTVPEAADWSLRQWRGVEFLPFLAHSEQCWPAAWVFVGTLAVPCILLINRDFPSTFLLSFISHVASIPKTISLSFQPQSQHQTTLASEQFDTRRLLLYVITSRNTTTPPPPQEIHRQNFRDAFHQEHPPRHLRCPRCRPATG